MRPDKKSDYSFHDDTSVPTFDDARILLVMDGACALCSGAARRIAAMDREDQIRITPANSILGRALLVHYGLDPDDPESWLMIRDGRAFGSLDAMIRLAGQLHPALGVMKVMRILPLPVQDWLYTRLARNRYRLFGKADLSALPDADLRHRLIE